MMKKIYFAMALAASACLPAFSQNLNPEVYVTNDYETRMGDVHKTGVPMTVPDSLTHFATDIDYSVFRTPYMGSYSFTPYSISMEPEARPYDGTRFYLRAGAGYSFHPMLRAVFTPVPKGLLRNSEYLGFDGYSGKYYSADSRSPYSGHDFNAGAGALLRWNKERFDLTGDLSWNGIYTADDAVRSNYNKVALALDIHSNTDDAAMQYDLGADIHYGADNVRGSAGADELGYKLEGYLCPDISKGFKLRVDVHSQGSWLKGAGLGPVIVNSAAPKAVFEWGKFVLQAGVRLAASNRFSIHPDIRADWLVARGLLGIYATVGGGQSAYDYSAFKAEDHWFDASYISSFKATVERISASLGFRGLIAGRLHYDLSGGYRILDDAALQGLAVDTEGLYVPGIVYGDYSQAWGKALVNWTGERFKFDLDALYSYTDLEKGASYLTLPAFKIGASAEYNWNRRAFACMRCKFVGARESTMVSLPAFVDLGLYGEYIFARNLSAWLQLGNLLNQKLTYSPTHIAGGLNFTAGICLKLQ